MEYCRYATAAPLIAHKRVPYNYTVQYTVDGDRLLRFEGGSAYLLSLPTPVLSSDGERPAELESGRFFSCWDHLRANPGSNRRRAAGDARGPAGQRRPCPYVISRERNVTSREGKAVCEGQVFARMVAVACRNRTNSRLPGKLTAFLACRALRPEKARSEG